MPQLGTIQVDTADPDLGTVSVPVYDVEDVEYPVWRVQTANGVGAVSLSDPSTADVSLLRIQTPRGVMAVDTALATQTTDSDADFHVTWDDTSYRDQWTEVKKDFNANIVSSPSVSGNALEVVYQNDSSFGASASYYFEEETGSEPEELWFQYYVRLDPDFTFGDKGGGKLPGAAGTYDVNGDGYNDGKGGDAYPGEAWSARMGFNDPWDNDFDWRISNYVYHGDQDGQYGDQFTWDHGTRDDGSIVAHVMFGQWYRIDQHVKMNTPGERDGILRGWVDGELGLDESDMYFRDDTDVKIQRFWFNNFYGGGWTSPQEQSVYFDEFKMSTSGPLADDLDAP